MKFAAALSFASLAAASALEYRNCAGNNCNRAVTGTRDGLLPLTVRSSQCASFLLTTVTPAAVTVTVTVDTAPSTTSAPAAGAVTIVPTAIPTYASACSSAFAYASACSCFGVTGSVTTAPAPTVTVTSALDYCDDL
ncbi:hypothetical protein B0H67DRAFT_649748 [Lasiosphaeris hirsuta]|uniref:Antifreeze protein n=1 Tax=Lasiosphaeris hirsuta TaxID=260670 RepID=A0AA39ZXG6_9PEZI|nr:hypothetical protein B0H67DRAFT_649748 [Lasiosphaeris hirsuta]